MSLTPYRDTLRVYKANTFSYSFTFEEDESPLDLTTLTNISVRLFNQNTTVFEHTVSGGELTISGASDNIISGSATDEVMDIAKRSYDMEVIFDNSGAITTYVVLNTKVIDAGSNNSTTAASFEVSITSSTGSIGGQPTVLYAETIEAKNAAEAAQLAAEQAAAGVNLPSIASGDADKFLQVKDDESGYELKSNVTLTTATDVSGNAWVLDEDDFASDSDTKVPTQQSAKKYVDDKASLSTLINLAWYDIKRDGTEVADEIQAVYDSYQNTPQEVIIFWPAGLYGISHPINTHGISSRGAGKWQTILVVNNQVNISEWVVGANNNDVSVIYSKNKNQVEFTHMGMNCNEAYCGGFNIFGGEYNVLDNLWVKDSANAPVQFYGANNTKNDEEGDDLPIYKARMSNCVVEGSLWNLIWDGEIYDSLCFGNISKNAANRHISIDPLEAGAETIRGLKVFGNACEGWREPGDGWDDNPSSLARDYAIGIKRGFFGDIINNGVKKWPTEGMRVGTGGIYSLNRFDNPVSGSEVFDIGIEIPSWASDVEVTDNQINKADVGMDIHNDATGIAHSNHLVNISGEEINVGNLNDEFEIGKNFGNNNLPIPVNTVNYAISSSVNGAQSVPNDSERIVIFETPSSDFLSAVDNTNGEITIPRDGFYDLQCSIQMQSDANAEFQLYMIRIPFGTSNETELVRDKASGFSSGSTYLNVATKISLNKGDIITFRVIQNSSSSKNITDAIQSRFSIQRV